MTTVIARAMMCMALVAPWNMMVLANSMFLAKQSGSMPAPLDMDVTGRRLHTMAGVPSGRGW